MPKSLREAFQEGYEKLTPEDFQLPVTPEKRIRVAAAVATLIRDTNMFGIDMDAPNGPNAESIRAILTMSEEEWALDVAELAAELTEFDPVSARERMDQTQEHHARQKPRRGRVS